MHPESLPIGPSALPSWSEQIGHRSLVAIGCRVQSQVVMAFLMHHLDLSLAEAVGRLSSCRGRRLRINPSFWMVWSLCRRGVL